MKRIIGDESGDFSIFDEAYRPFFILAATASLFYMTIWTAFYTFHFNLNFENISPTMWHAHEMLFGYAMAVITGFLLTVEKYWLGYVIKTKSVLVSLVILWLLARVSISIAVITDFPREIGANLDCLFFIVLTVRVSYPIIKIQAWGKMVPSAHLAVITAGNVLFYLGLFGLLSNGQYWGLYAALYAVISLILIMGRRMIPIFTRNGLQFKFEPRNWRVIDISAMLFFVLFFISVLFITDGRIASIISGILALILSIRLYGWYSGKIWTKPLLWVLFVAYGWIAVGFALKFLSLYFNIPGFLSLHSFTYGGIGIMTMGFMCRVVLGHTGRDVFNPPKILFWIFALLFAGAIVRVFVPLIDPGRYTIWIAASQLLWIASFLIYTIVYFPMLFRPALEKKS